MYICMCNPFTDKDLSNALKDGSAPKKTADLYKACSGGEKPNCGTCLCEIRERLDAHNDETLLIAAE